MDKPLQSLIEDRVLNHIRNGEKDLIALAGDLIRFDTTARNVGDPPRQEAMLQEYLRARLAALGAEVDVWEPEATGTGNRVVPDNLDFVGRPQLAARWPGAGGGRSILLNGHIDAVSPEPLDQWTSHPLQPEVRDGNLFGRGSCDMKGGIAGMLFALEALNNVGAKLAGDVIFCTDTDEESSGAGAYACSAHGVHADAGICAEPTSFDVWVACRGGVNPRVRTLGRAGHAEMSHPAWREGGPVNAIEKMEIVLASLRALRQDWESRSEFEHPYLHKPHVLPTMIKGGEWMVTYPSNCEATLSVVYLPGQVKGERGGQDVFDEVESWVRAATEKDDWLAENPPLWEWPCDIIPAEVPENHPVVTSALAAAADVGRVGHISGLDSWHDAAVFTRVAGTPTVSFGPGSLAKAHATDEAVPVQDLIDYAAAVALVLLRWCGVAKNR